jgi:hypothetical protein
MQEPLLRMRAPISVCRSRLTIGTELLYVNGVCLRRGTDVRQLSTATCTGFAGAPLACYPTTLLCSFPEEMGYYAAILFQVLNSNICWSLPSTVTAT